MTDDDAKDKLADLLKRYTLGSVLHLLGELAADQADDASMAGAGKRAEQLRTVEATLNVVGMGIDAAVQVD